MSVSAPPRPRPDERSPGSLRRVVHARRAPVLAVLAVVAGAVAVQQQEIVRAVVGLLALVLFAVVAQTDRRLAVVIVVIWLVLLGFMRRFLIPFVGWNEQDPLLLVSPATAVILWYIASRDRTAPRSVLGSLGAVLFLWTLAEVFNPAEPSLVLGAQALLFWATPWLWFFVGRALGADEQELLQRTIFWSGLVVVGHGLWQTFFGLLPFEYTWLSFSGPGAAIFVGGFNIRPFSTLVSPQEYGVFLSFLLTLIFARLVHPGSRRGLLLAYFAVCGMALFYQGTRSFFVFVPLAIVVMTIVRIRTAGAALVLSTVLVFAGAAVAPALLRADAPERYVLTEEDASNFREAVTRRTASGFSDPSQSTLPLHVELIVDAFRVSFEHPFGTGIGRASIAADKTRPENAVKPENDVASVFAALGPIGGLIFLVFMVTAFVGAAIRYRAAPSHFNLALIGMLIVALTQWWNGALYATSPILFFGLGGVARFGSRRVRGRAEGAAASL